MRVRHTFPTLFASAILAVLDLHAEPRQVAPEPILTLLVDNYAGVDAETLGAATGSAHDIYRRAGVETRWVNCGTRIGREVVPAACERLPAPDVIRVRIMPTRNPRLHGVGRYVYGFAVPPQRGRFGWAATVFRDRVATTAVVRQMAEATLLGAVLAHETGHLLLGRNSHTSHGLMSGSWTRAELQKIAEGALGFVGRQKRQIQLGVEARRGARTQSN